MGANRTGETGTDTPLEAARRMLDIFAGVGAERFHVTWTNSAGSPRCPRSLRSTLQSLGGPLPHTDNDDWLDAIHIAGISAADLRRTIPALLDTATTDRVNLTIRPRATSVRFIQLDDLSAEKLPALAPAMFLIIETSPGNYQAWLAMPGEHDREFARRVRRGIGADVTASGATKIAGSLNFKDKYAPNYPRVTICEAQPGRMTSPAELERMGLVAPPEKFAPLSPARPGFRGTEKWPTYALCLDKAPPNRDGSGPDRSRADYVWCMIAISWGHGIDDTAAHLLQESRKAREDGKSYALQTARQAAAAVERRRQQRPLGYRMAEHGRH
jgi:RepB DNA-primase from phage plasmid